MHSNTKLISMSETHTYIHTHSYKYVYKVTAIHKDVHIHAETVNILHVYTCTNSMKHRLSMKSRKKHVYLSRSITQLDQTVTKHKG